MNDIIQNLELNATNGRENFCYINEKQLNAMKELSKREAEENKQLKMQISAREEEYRKLENNWNKLKEYIEKTKIKEFEKSYGKRFGKTFTQAEIIVCNMVKDKMQELEQGSDNDA